MFFQNKHVKMCTILTYLNHNCVEIATKEKISIVMKHALLLFKSNLNLFFLNCELKHHFQIKFK